MKLDSSNSHSTANETKRFHTAETNAFQKGRHVSEPDRVAGPEVEKYTVANETQERKLGITHTQETSTPWCYLFVHHRKVKAFEEKLRKDHITYFIHKSIKYVPKKEDGNGVKKTVVQTVSGLIFLRGEADELQQYLDDKFFSYHLCKNCSTGNVAEIPNSQMESFMRVAQSDPDHIRFLLRPFVYYSKNRTRLRIVSGDFAGLEGYVIRIARDRKIVIDVGGMGVAIGGIHAERFEEVGKNEATKQDRATFGKRNLHERNAFIDHYFHKVTTAQEVAAQTENIELLRLQTLTDLKDGTLDIKEAHETLYFIIEEIGYYYAPFIDTFKNDLRPIFDAGRKVMHDLEHIISALRPNTDQRQHWEAEQEELRTNYGYLFE